MKDMDRDTGTKGTDEKLTVHYLKYGFTACLQNGPPKDWPNDHKWSSEWKDVNCPGCLAGRELIHTFRISEDGKTITCLICGFTSYNLNDVAKHFCDRCDIFHDDIWPPARKAMIRKNLIET